MIPFVTRVSNFPLGIRSFFSFVTLILYRAEADIQEVRNLVLDSAVVAKQDKGGCGTARHRGRYAGGAMVLDSAEVVKQETGDCGTG